MTTSIGSLKTLPPKLALSLALAEKSRRHKRQVERKKLLVPVASTSTPSLVLPEDGAYHFLLEPSRYKVAKGGRGGAKSWGFAEALIRRGSVECLRILCTRETQNSIEDSVHHLLVKTINRLGMNSWYEITKNSIRSRTGTEFRFRGLRDTSAESIKSFEDADIVWVEEARTVSLTSWKFLTPTVRKPGSEIWISYNPENDDDPIYTYLVKSPPPGCVIRHINFDQNPFFTAELEMERQRYLQRIDEADNDTERKQAQADYDHVWLGEFKTINEALILSGKIRLEEFDSELWRQADRLLFGTDFGFSQDPLVLTRSFILNDCLYIEYEAYGISVELDEMAEFYRSVPGSEEWPIKADNARPETISYLSRQGFSISAADKWSGSVEDGIAHLRAFKKIIIHPRCRHTYDESKMYSYKRDSKTKEVLPVIVDKFNHCWDAVRYSLDGYIQRRGALGTWSKLAT